MIQEREAASSSERAAPVAQHRSYSASPSAERQRLSGSMHATLDCAMVLGCFYVLNGRHSLHNGSMFCLVLRNQLLLGGYGYIAYPQTFGWSDN